MSAHADSVARSLEGAGADTIRDFWLGRTAVEGPKAARFHSRHDPYDLAAIHELRGPGSRVLDLGCGTCVIANLLVAELDCSVHAVDYVAGLPRQRARPPAPDDRGRRRAHLLDGPSAST